jgi:GTPase SAR1 family protein
MDKHNKLINEIIDGIICDITMRSGIGDEWDNIDSETIEDIKKEWKKIILDEFEAE